MADAMDQRIVRFLTERGVAFRIHEHEAARTVAEAEARVPFPPEQFLKTLAFRTRDGRYVLAALRGRDRIDYRRLAEAVSVKRAALAQATPAEVEEKLGFAPGAIGPIAPGAGAVLIVDERASGVETVFCGAGRADLSLEIAMADLLAVSGASVAEIAARSGRSS